MDHTEVRSRDVEVISKEFQGYGRELELARKNCKMLSDINSYGTRRLYGIVHTV